MYCVSKSLEGEWERTWTQNMGVSTSEPLELRCTEWTLPCVFLSNTEEEVMNGDLCNLSLFDVESLYLSCMTLNSSFTLSEYLFPRAVVTVRVKSHRLRFELLYDRVILIQQTHGHLVGTATIRPPTVPAG